MTNLRFLSSHLKYPIATFHTLESIIYFDFPISRHSRLAPSLDNKVRLHNLLVFRVAAAEHISQSLFEAVTSRSVPFHSLKPSIAFLRNLPESCVVLSFIVFAAKSLITCSH
ncbi:hypothetical protein P8452_47257 [Trifolium repens]|nr:hypothetical protein P8452_47257 [Trifolium repens]